MDIHYFNWLILRIIERKLLSHLNSNIENKKENSLPLLIDKSWCQLINFQDQRRRRKIKKKESFQWIIERESITINWLGIEK